ncbi:unnamed protein product, partial [Timema podura]|nr:unnamed protein product [Timema podura]
MEFTRSEFYPLLPRHRKIRSDGKLTSWSVCPLFKVLRDWSCVCGTVAALWGTAGQYARKIDVRYRNVAGG